MTHEAAVHKVGELLLTVVYLNMQILVCHINERCVCGCGVVSVVLCESCFLEWCDIRKGR